MMMYNVGRGLQLARAKIYFSSNEITNYFSHSIKYTKNQDYYILSRSVLSLIPCFFPNVPSPHGKLPECQGQPSGPSHDRDS